MIIRNARLRGHDGLHDVTIEDGKIASISFETPSTGEVTIDAAGRLVTESFVVAHLHLDKVWTGRMVTQDALKAYQEDSMDTSLAIHLASEVKKGYNEQEITQRVRPLLEEAITHGVTHMRGFADTDTKARLEAVKALLNLKSEFKGRLELQVVAFPQEGIESDPGAEEYVEKAIELGADVVGGIPWLEPTVDKQESHIDKMFAIAMKYNRPVAMLVDDAGDPNLRTLEMLASKCINEGWNGRVQACHARAMQLYPDDYSTRLASICKAADIGIVTDPQTGPLHARIDTLMEAGVTVALGQDDCYDAYYPYGRCKMIEVAFLCSHLLRKMTPKDMDTLYDMITINPAKIIGIPDFTLREGRPANLVILEAASIHEAFACQAEPALVINQGNVVYEKIGR